MLASEGDFKSFPFMYFNKILDKSKEFHISEVDFNLSKYIVSKHLILHEHSRKSIQSFQKNRMRISKVQCIFSEVQVTV